MFWLQLSQRQALLSPGGLEAMSQAGDSPYHVQTRNSSVFPLPLMPRSVIFSLGVSGLPRSFGTLLSLNAGRHG